MKKFSAITLAQFQAMSVPGGKVLVVDGTNGSDTKGLRGSSVRAYKTLTAAKTAAQSGDTIVVFPGSYTESNLLKNGVNWYFYPGTIVTSVVTDANGTSQQYGIFDDRATGAVTCEIAGRGIFIFDTGAATGAPNTNLRGAVYFQNAATDVKFQCAAIRVNSLLDPVPAANTQVPAVYAFRIDGGKVVLECDAIEDVTFGTDTTLGGGLLFRWGTLTAKIHRLKVNLCPFVAWEVDSPPATIAHCDLICAEAQNYTDFGVFNVLEGSTQNFRIAIRCGQMFSENAASAGDGVVVSGGGHVTIDVHSYITPGQGSAFVVNDANLGIAPVVVANLHYAKINENIFLLGILAGVGVGPIFYGRCDYMESASEQNDGAAADVRQASTKAVLTGKYWKGGSSTVAMIAYTGGDVRIKGVTIDNKQNSSTTSRAVNLNGATGLILEGCTLLSHASNDSSIYSGSAATVKLYNSTYTNKAKHANVTVQAGLGTLVVDANVS